MKAKAQLQKATTSPAPKQLAALAFQDPETERLGIVAQLEGAARLCHSLGAIRVDSKPPTIIQRQEAPEEEEEEIQTKTEGYQEGPEGGLVPPDVEAAIQRARGGGQPLDGTIQAQMGETLGHDFSSVRVHANAEANVLNHQLGARAFTTGRDIFFRQGEYSPNSGSGRELIAHELSHVVQQSTGRISGGGGGMTVRPDGDAFEQEAEAMGAGVGSARESPILVAHGRAHLLTHEALKEEDGGPPWTSLAEAGGGLGSQNRVVQMTNGKEGKPETQITRDAQLAAWNKLPKDVYRLDKRTPENLAAVGFQPLDPTAHKTIEQHIRRGDSTRTSQYVSTMEWVKSMPHFATKEYYLYRIDPEFDPFNYVRVQTYFVMKGEAEPYPEQKEWIHEGGIPALAITHYSQATDDGRGWFDEWINAITQDRAISPANIGWRDMPRTR